MAHINLMNVDCMEYMRSLPDKAYELAIVDPPYYSNAYSIITPGGRLSTTGVERRKYEMPHWEPPTPEYFKELFRVSKHQIIWGINYFLIENPGMGRIVWDKVKDNGTNFSDCEIAYCSLLKHVKIFRYMWNGMLQGKSMHEGTVMQGNKTLNEKRIHPTQKPVALYKWLLATFATPGDRILDTHLGSGSIAIACHELGFDLDACEIDPAYFAKTVQRFEAHKQQPVFDFNRQEVSK